MMNRLPICLLVGLFFATEPARPSTEWAWFRASGNAVTGWTLNQGWADVLIAGKSFKATLWDESNSQFARLSLDGSVSGNAVTARITVNGSDYDEPYRTTGTLKRTCSKDGGLESIVFTNGFNVVGLAHGLTSADCRRRQ